MSEDKKPKGLKFSVRSGGRTVIDSKIPNINKPKGGMTNATTTQTKSGSRRKN